MRGRRTTFGAVLLVTLLAALDQTIVATALPQMASDLDAFDDLSWVVTAYLVTSTVTIPLYGKLSDLFGRRRLFVVSISVFVVGSALCGAAGSMTELIAFRALQGLGAGGLLPLAQATIADLFSPRERGRYQGYIASMWGVAAIAGPLVGGTLTDAVSWRWIFYVNLPLGAWALFVVLRHLRPADVRREHRIDVTGAVLLALGIGAVLLALSWGGTTHPWGSAPVLGAAALGLALLVALAVVERRAAEPIVPLPLLRNRVFRVAVAAQFVVGAILFAVTIYVPVGLQEGEGATATTSGGLVLWFSGGWVVTATIAGRYMARTGRYRVLPIVGSSLTATGVAVLAVAGVGGSHVLLAAVLLAGGLGMGLTNQAYLVATQNAVAGGDIGAATGGLQFFRAMGGSLAVAGLGALVANRVGGDHTPEAVASAMHAVFAIATALAVAGVALALALEERPLGTRPAAAMAAERE